MMYPAATVGEFQKSRQTITSPKAGFPRPAKAQGLKASEFNCAAGDDGAAKTQGCNLIFFL